MRWILAQDERGADRAEASDRVDDFLQTTGVAGIHVEDEAIFSGDAVDGAHLGQSLELLQSVGDLRVCRPEPNDRMRRKPYRFRDDARCVAGDDPGILQPS